MALARRVMMWILIVITIGIGLILIIVMMGRYRFNQMVQAEITSLMDNAQTVDGVFSSENINHLPEPVQRYLTRNIPEGYPLIDTVYLQQDGLMRQSPEADWSPFVAEQYFTTNPPAFIWIADMHMMPMLSVTARDKYTNGHGEMLISLQSTVPIANGQGTNYDTGAFIRYMAEMMWLPTAMLHDYIQWETVDDETAIAIAQVAEQNVRVTFHFNEQGDIDYIESHDRHMGDEANATPWYGYCSDYQTFYGVRIPTSVEVGWQPETGYYAWWRGNITDIEFNNISTS